MKINKENMNEIVNFSNDLEKLQGRQFDIKKDIYDTKINKIKRRKIIENTEEEEESKEEEKDEGREEENQAHRQKEMAEAEKANKEIVKKSSSEKEDKKKPIFQQVKEKIEKDKEKQKRLEIEEFEKQKQPLNEETLVKITKNNIQIKGYDFSDDKGEKKKEKFKKQKIKDKQKEDRKRREQEFLKIAQEEIDKKTKIFKNEKPDESLFAEQGSDDEMELQKMSDIAEKKIFNYEIKFQNPNIKNKQKEIPYVTKLHHLVVEPDPLKSSKQIKETIKEVKERKNKKDESEEEEVEKEEESSLESFTEESGINEEEVKKLVDIAKKVRQQNIEPRLGLLRPRRKLVLDDAKEGLIFNKLLQDMSEDDIALQRDYILIPSSQSNVDNVTYEFLGAFLGELGKTSEDCLRFASGLMKDGFKVPDALYGYLSKFIPIPFRSMLKTRPGLFACYGPTFGALAPFRKPNPLKSKKALNDKKVSYQEISELLGNLPREIKKDKFVSELLALIYLGDAFGDEIPDSPNTAVVFEAFGKGVENCKIQNARLKEDIKEMVAEPEIYIKKLIPNALYYSPNERITLINDKEEIGDVRVYDIAKVIKTSFKINPPDLIAVTILSKFVPMKIPEIALQVLQQYYVGTGSIADIAKRYNKSLEIYKESNSQACQSFHKKYYKENFSKAMEYLGYYLEPKFKTRMTTDIYQFLALTDVAGARLIGVNNHATGTFTSPLKRNETSLLEIEAGLKNFSILKEDPSNEGFQFFYYGFKKVAAKFKDEIHSFDKPPRFYNPTFIAAFIPFQFLFNYCFQYFQPFTKKNPFSLLGIKDVGTNFYTIMMKIYQSDNLRLHYSDNFWIKEGSKFVSVDVKRCDSNLSKEALFYPISYLAKLVLEGEDLKRMLILAKIFVKTIPREALFGVSQGKDTFLYSFPFFWLPSGVVGTAYINHMFTGTFLYYTRNEKWIDEKGGLTKEVIEKAKKFGIHLEVASYVDFSNIKDGDIVNFDLLARSAIFWGGVFIPILDHKRVWMSLLFVKKGKYDKNSLISNYVRLSKINSMLSLGAGLDPVLGQFIFAFLLYLTSSIRNSFITLTPEQSKMLVDQLEEYSITPDSFTKEIFANQIPDAQSYIKNKTGKDLEYPPALEFDKKIKEKLDLYPSVWASLGEVVNGVERRKEPYLHKQYGTRPYFVAPYFFKFLGTLNFGFSNLNMFSKYLLLLFGNKLGLGMFKDFISILINEFKGPFFKPMRKAVAKILKESVDKIKESSNQSIEKIKKAINDGMDAFMADPKLEHIEFSIPPKEGGSVTVTSRYKYLMMGFNIFNKVNLTQVFGNFSDIWSPIKGTRFVRYLNFAESYLLFEGEYWYDAAREKKLQREAPPVNEYRTFPIEFFGNKIFDPVALKSEIMNMEVEGKTPFLDDLGALTGIVTEYITRYPLGFSNFTNEKIYDLDPSFKKSKEEEKGE